MQLPPTSARGCFSTHFKNSVVLLHVQVVTSLPSMSALKAAAAAGTTAAPGATLKTPDLSFQGLLDARLYRTVVAWLCKDSGKRPAEIVVSASLAADMTCQRLLTVAPC